ncbi:hypothetical protein GLOIN_2v1627547 [Rhizophagus irregularis DAOM 181602=DAOM 197198]|uniref:Uncharacterized protein n=1 Tax=Rhizophagus irregularis (strain DAOM 181602 / DAOM 197198 / MUCL 43194) TaxID=747089 RepID=A0A2P4PVJ1_RHIID|nr:hypothetical protein GLOIN_2v1627547 [Rhizophagus irregularis DAOM 181602=DAOM 197198]POG69417.1 hypothetical protein GLOIN_2v1627547 [Rhizophagus irregularis DAOM 181602=DAOM 197198]|eukprot:XP_025176283.1 hypothetical protein GLOIN_2v1627547 [Rhizophagus irregularis DAOM 181602=DAOM 197198]
MLLVIEIPTIKFLSRLLLRLTGPFMHYCANITITQICMNLHFDYYHCIRHKIKHP